MPTRGSAEFICFSSDLAIMVFSASDAFRRQSLKDARFLLRGKLFDPVLDDCKHALMQLPRMIQQGRMTEARQNRVDSSFNVAGSIRPSGDNFGYRVVNNDFCKLTGGVVQVTAKISWYFDLMYLK
jgi:hypothetical protein